MVNYHCGADDEVPRRDREQPFFLVGSISGSEQMSMRARKVNRRTSWGGFPGISEIAAGAKRGRHNESGDPSRIRTCNPRSRNPLLYPVELWDRCRLHSTANMKNPLRRQARSEPFCASRRLSLRGWTVAFGPRPSQCCATAGFRPGRGSRRRTKGSLRQMLHATFSPPPCPAMSPSPFRVLLHVTRPGSALGVPT
jgi:hypothetical protein